MIFYGWNHQIEKSMGEYQGEACGQCEQTACKLMRIRTFFTLFFIPLICYRTVYYKQCLACGAKTQLSKNEAHDIMDLYLPWSKSKMQIGNVVRYVVLAIVAAVIALMIFLPEDEEAVGGTQPKDTLGVDGIKALVNGDDGFYRVYNKEGDWVADIDIEDGKKKAHRFVEYYTYEDHEVPAGHTFTEIHYFYERAKSELAYVEDQAVVIMDDEDMSVRYFWLDTYEDELYWDYGVEDFSTIEYGTDEDTYVYESYMEGDEAEYYTQVCKKNEKYDVILLFYNGKNRLDQKGLSHLKVIEYDGRDKPAVQESYYPYNMPFKPNFSIEKIMQFLEENQVQAEKTYTYTYFEDTPIIERLDYEEWDYASEGLIKETYRYSIEKLDNGYYVRQDIE